MHMGGLSGTVTTAQTVNLDLNANLATDNLDERKGDANFSDVQWWLEWYTDTGSTAVTATVGVTYNDGTSGNLSAISLAATRRASLMVPLNPLVHPCGGGRQDSFKATWTGVTLSATTGTAGSFGVTATRPRTSVCRCRWPTRQRFSGLGFDLGLPAEMLQFDSCLMIPLECGEHDDLDRHGARPAARSPTGKPCR
jgi:hypothetical protein